MMTVLITIAATVAGYRATVYLLGKSKRPTARAVKTLLTGEGGGGPGEPNG